MSNAALFVKIKYICIFCEEQNCSNHPQEEHFMNELFYLITITLIVRLTPSNGVVGLICDNRAGSFSLLPQTPFVGYGMQQTFCTLYNLTRSRFSLVKKLLSTSLGDTDASKSRKCLVYVC